MKRVLLFTFCLVVSVFVKAQIGVSEPDFSGEVFYVETDSTYQMLEKSRAKIRVRDQVWGPAKKIYVEQTSSPMRIPQGKIQLVVRAVENQSDPLSIIQIFKFDIGTTRKATLARQNELTGNVAYNKLKLLSFIGKRYGNSSYLVTINNIEVGEYGITVNNPNLIDEKSIMVSCFGVD